MLDGTRNHMHARVLVAPAWVNRSHPACQANCDAHGVPAGGSKNRTEPRVTRAGRSALWESARADASAIRLAAVIQGEETRGEGRARDRHRVRACVLRTREKRTGMKSTEVGPADISAELAHAVLDLHGLADPVGRYTAGGFGRLLLQAIAHADAANLARFRLSFPAEVAAFEVLRSGGGPDQLRAIASGVAA